MNLPLPDINISIRPGERVVVTLAKPGSEPVIVPTLLSPIQLSEYRNEFYRGLNQFLNRVATGGEITDFDLISSAVNHLHLIGRTLNLTLFGNENRYKIESFFIGASPSWKRSGSEGSRAPIVRVTSLREHSLPLEFLPLFDTAKPGDITNIDELSQTVARFPGFSTIIQRVFVQPNSGSSEGSENSLTAIPLPLENSPHLPVRFFRHVGLAGARREREFLQGAGWIEMRGPWPDRALYQNDFVVKLATQLWDEPAEPEVDGQTPDQIHHFACHCDTEDESSLDHTLSLAHMNTWGRPSVRNVAIRALKGEFGSYPQKTSTVPRPLVFLNACGSSKLTPNGVASFPDMFLSDIGNRGVIGTETRIPDSFAAQFSEQFYLNLIHGSTLGEAVFKARWTLLKRLNNPLGILYSVYADPYLQVRKPMPEAVSPLVGTKRETAAQERR